MLEKLQQSASSRWKARAGFGAYRGIFSLAFMPANVMAGTNFSSLAAIPAQAGAVGAHLAAATLAARSLPRNGLRARGHGAQPPPAIKKNQILPHAALAPRLLPIPRAGCRG